ncbi:sensor histidine kinase [Kordia sp.]|uniref:sensor histidine kinase n=1 Tax=Kordia sp. TaxID=1965332 RepID=UPI003B58BDD7
MQNYKKAIESFKKALQFDSISIKKPKQYAMLLNNLAYSQFKLNEHSNLPKLFYESLKIRDSIQHIDGIIISKIRLSEYYLAEKDTLKSYQFINDANILSIKQKTSDNLLLTYDLLAKVDPKNSTKYLRRYIEISDSTLLEERRMRDKFTRIEYETDELEEEYNKVKTEAKQLEGEATKYKRRNKRVYRILWWIGGILIILTIIFSVRYYQRTLRNKYEKVVLQQRLLRSQMNPHFLFNTLNTILHTNDTNPEKTKQYVLKLSRLLRTTLENSREEFVPIQDEIEAIDHYLNLQSNFSAKFDFKVTIAPELETEFTYVPPMLIQPFVENAIIHGIMNTKTRGLISLNFAKNGEDLISCTIVDNGIGYSKSLQEGKNNAKTHNSISGDIVKERLAIYKKQTKSNASLEIEDILDSEQQCVGTKVILNLPSYEI